MITGMYFYVSLLSEDTALKNICYLMLTYTGKCVYLFSSNSFADHL